MTERRPDDELSEWERLLASEGLPARPKRRQIRGPRGTADRARAVSREVLSSWEVWEHRPDTFSRWRRPETVIEALMICAPHEQPELSREELLPLRDVILDAIEDMPSTYRLAVECFARGLTLRQAGEIMQRSPSSVSSTQRRAFGLLRDMLEGHPLIVAYLERHSEEETT